MLSYRELLESDISRICRFPRTPAELFYMFPAAQWPLTADQLSASAEGRSESTVVVCEEIVAGYANFISCAKGERCCIGNVIVNPAVRRQGVGTYLMRVMIAKAFESYQAASIRLRCFSANRAGIRLYETLGFQRVAVLPRKCPDGCIAPAYEFELENAVSSHFLKASA